jgi:hypothetical protein
VGVRKCLQQPPVIECEGDRLWFAPTEEHSLKIFEGKVLRKILDPKGDKVVQGRRKLHTEHLRMLYSSLSGGS